jgi:uncharacterized protein (UPF0276 family)
MKSNNAQLPYLGFGLGLRHCHFDYILQHQPKVDWFEIISEDFMIPGGKAWHSLEKIRANYPVVMHGVSLSIGSYDPLNMAYLKDLKALADRLQPAWVSDHLCWTGVNNINLHDLLPLPYTEACLEHVVERVCRVQDYLQRQILLENPSTYLEFTASTIPEWEFLNTLAERADCLVLLDINNIYVNAFNHHYSPTTYLAAIDPVRVQQFHLAGHSQFENYIIDTHDAPVIENVWQLYTEALKRFPRVSTMIERDGNIPEFPELWEELQIAKRLYSETRAVEVV